ncbi:MAG: CBS domain-containing protein [Gammaproteobacteria bacterium]|nr:MAG: CBS domain-containing protein [Gammaproteobacteria bacterium]
MLTVAQLLERKGNQVWTIGPDQTVFDAIALMAEKRIGALAVVENEDLVGIISERDYATKVILRERRSRETPVREIMSTELITVDEGADLETCMKLMTENRIRHLPVLENGRLKGMLSIGDVLVGSLEDRENLIEQLQGYIAGNM